MTIFLSDIVKFTDLTDTLEPERLALVINSYLSEMSAIALESGGTIDKFIGDAVLVFFGDPDSEGEREDALKCIEMGLRMKKRVEELQKHWKNLEWQMEFPSGWVLQQAVVLSEISAQTFVSTILYLAVR